MNSRERVIAHLEGRPVDRLPLMPITMMFACDQIGARYRDYCTDYRVLVEAQIRTADAFGFDYVNTMSDPGPGSFRLRRHRPVFRPSTGRTRGGPGPARGQSRFSLA